METLFARLDGLPSNEPPLDSEVEEALTWVAYPDRERWIEAMKLIGLRLDSRALVCAGTWWGDTSPPRVVWIQTTTGAVDLAFALNQRLQGVLDPTPDSALNVYRRQQLVEVIVRAFPFSRQYAWPFALKESLNRWQHQPDLPDPWPELLAYLQQTWERIVG